MEFLSLPAELILKALEGLSIQDIVNVAQVCSRCFGTDIYDPIQEEKEFN